MICEDRHMELARKTGPPDPEYNAAIGNGIVALMDAWRYEDVAARLHELTNPSMRNDLENMMAFGLRCCFLPRPDEVLKKT